MASALEKLVKILKLEQEQGNKNTAVIGGLGNFVAKWTSEAHAQAKRPEHHALVDELAALVVEYEALEDRGARRSAVRFMLDRVVNRVPPRQDLAHLHEAAAQRSAPPPREAPSPEPEPALPPEPAAPAAEAGPEPEAKAPPPPARPEPQRPAAPAVRAVHRKARPPLDLEAARETLRGLDAPVTVLNRVGASMAEKLEKLGIRTIGDMLFTFPHRYDDYTRLKPINHLLPGETVTVIGTVVKADLRNISGGRKLFEVEFGDGAGTLTVSWFNQPWLRNRFKPGTQLALRGKVDLYLGKRVMTNPDWELLERDLLFSGTIVPVYPLTKGLTARTMRRLMRQTVDYWASRIPDYIPLPTLERANLGDLGWALQQVHFPDSWDALDQARTRIVFDELLLLQLGVLAHRREWQSVPGVPLRVGDEWLQAFRDALPYALTGAQQRALDDIRADMAAETPMNRLLQGDVGSGKTVVAAIALCIAIANGAQAALMAPTSILAEQHFASVRRLLAESPVAERMNARLLTGATPDAERAETYAGLADGSINLVIGTHALIQGGVNFANLGLAVIDEQHRFGVEQRGALRGKGTNPHLLVMTATPIPRTLALTLYADLDLSIIDEMPPGRTPVDTRVILPKERERAYAFIRSRGREGPAGVHHLPARRGRGRAGRDVGGEAGGVPAERGVPAAQDRAAARTPPPRRKGRGHGRFRPWRSGHPGRHVGGRGGHRRAERLGDDDRGRGALRPGAASPVPRARGARRARLVLPARGRRGADGGGRRAAGGGGADHRRLQAGGDRLADARPRRPDGHAAGGRRDAAPHRGDEPAPRRSDAARGAHPLCRGPGPRAGGTRAAGVPHPPVAGRHRRRRHQLTVRRRRSPDHPAAAPAAGPACPAARSAGWAVRFDRPSLRARESNQGATCAQRRLPRHIRPRTLRPH
ncbi:MAG: ATP-dependent DNA helicase RecG [Anaerolineae bacterium]|nr:ATP-dependent DNA helicase RecG [Anaerolineae bacterium]